MYMPKKRHKVATDTCATINRIHTNGYIEHMEIMVDESMVNNRGSSMLMLLMMMMIMMMMMMMMIMMMMMMMMIIIIIIIIIIITYNTIRSDTLSGGEKQKLAMARL